MSLWFDGNTIAVFQLCTEGLIGTTHIVQWSRGQTKSGFPHVLLSSSTWNEVYLWALWMYLEEWRSEIDSFEKYQIWSKMESDNRTFPNIFSYKYPRRRLLHHSSLLQWQAVANPTTQKLPPCSLPQRLFDVIVFLSHQFSPMFHNGQSSILAVWSPLNGVYSASTDDNIEQYNERSSCDAKMRCHTFLLPTINFTDEVKDFCWWKHSFRSIIFLHSKKRLKHKK